MPIDQIAPSAAATGALDGDLLATKAFRAAAKRVAPSLVTVEAIGVVREDIQAVGRPATLRAFLRTSYHTTRRIKAGG